NLEYTFPVIKDAGLKGVLFFDVGNAWADDEDYFSDMRYSTGWGIRWMSPMGPLRLEWGYNLDPREGEKSSEFEFSIGRFF
ncbi:MAG TPA: BamA/TamA family outer membrane protein, partial [Desulfuromonadales bacterium]|nr:BamA/TamA family outer membrane protein [Desulfuromonadales bacterium]